MLIDVEEALGGFHKDVFVNIFDDINHVTVPGEVTHVHIRILDTGYSTTFEVEHNEGVIITPFTYINEAVAITAREAWDNMVNNNYVMYRNNTTGSS